VSVRRLLGGAVLVIALVLLLGRWTASLYADYHWYLALGAREVWRAKLVSTAILTLGSFAIAALFAFMNLYAVRQSVVSLVLPRRIGNLEFGEEVPGRYLLAVASGLSVAIGIALTFPPDRWAEVLLARVGRAFGESDPYFDLDLGFFVYWLPFESALHSWAVIVLATVCVVVVMLYALTPSLKWDRGALYVSAYVRRHFTVLGAVVLLMLAWSYRLAMYRFIGEGSGPAGLFTEVDHKLLTPMFLLALITLCSAFVVAWAGWTGQMRLAFGTVTGVLLLSLLAKTVAPLVLRRSGDTLERRRYIATRLTYTRHAYAVDPERMRTDTIGSGFSSTSDAAAHLAVWDGATLTRAAERIRHVRAFGDGPAWSVAGGSLVAHIVERGTETSPELRDVWGISRFDPTSADERGQPTRIGGGNDDLLIPEPVVYDSAPAYTVLSNASGNIAGVEMVSTRSRLMHAWSLQNFRLLFGDLPANHAMMVERRDVRERVGALVPFFEQGSEVVPLVANDTLYWVLELYATSATYPLSQRFTVLGAERSYVHHAATAVVHAASGRVRIILTATPDPVTLSWVAYFPSLFRSVSSLPRSVAPGLPPLTDHARTQALAFAAAGFADNTERRHFAAPDGADSAAAREPTRVALPELGGVTSLWTLLDSTDRVRGVIAAPGGNARVTTWIPLASDGRRWGSVVDRVRTADTALHETGVLRSPLRVLPVQGRPLYVQPSFIARPGGAPVLAHVSAMSGDSVHVGTTLASALGMAQPVRSTISNTAGDLRARADSLYRVMREALARSDWVVFGRAFDALGGVIRGLPK
jgi:uncharacterized protein